jgi:hypothetical protein
MFSQYPQHGQVPFVAVIPDSNACPGFCKALGNGQANFGAGARDDSGFAPQGKWK